MDYHEKLKVRNINSRNDNDTSFSLKFGEFIASSRQEYVLIDGFAQV